MTAGRGLRWGKGGEPERNARAETGAWKEGSASPGARGNERGMGARLGQGEKWERGGRTGGRLEGARLQSALLPVPLNWPLVLF